MNFVRQIIIDTETTGLEPDLGHRVIEIACVELLNRRITKKKLHFYLNPEREIDPEAKKIHGLTERFLSDKPKFLEICDKFLDFIKGSEIIAHNAGFDVKFLNSELGRLGFHSLKSYCTRVIDSLLHARQLHPGKKNSLDALCDRYGIENNNRSLHGALLDSYLLARVWLAMTRGQDSLLIADKEKDNSDVPSPHMQMEEYGSCLPVVKATMQELEEHQEYLKNLLKVSGQCIWFNLESN